MAFAEKNRALSSVIIAWSLVVLSIAFIAVASGVMLWAYDTQNPLGDSEEAPGSRVSILQSQEIVALRKELEIKPDPNVTLNQYLKFKEQEEETKEKIRQLEVKLRVEYFYLARVRHIGGYVLLGALIALVVSLKLTASLYEKLPRPCASPASDDDARRMGFWSKVSAGFVGAGILAGAVVLAVICLPGISRSSLGLDKVAEKIPAPASTAYQKENPWPQFRGVAGAGYWPGSEIPIKFDGRTLENVRWKVLIKLPGRNSPIVYGNRVIVTGADEGIAKVFCFDTDTGRLAWKADVQTDESKAAGPVKVWYDEDWGNTRAAVTAATDGKSICVAFPSGDIACFDFFGKEIWKRYIRMDVMYGQGSSLVIHKNLLLIQRDQKNTDNDDAKLFALDIATGETIWEAVRNDVKGSWSTPVVVESKTGFQIICASNPYIIAHDATNGEELWRSDELLGSEIAPTPVCVGGKVFVAYGELFVFAIDNNGSPGKPIEPKWTGDSGAGQVASPATNGEIIVLQDDRGMLTGYSLDGKLLWELEVSEEQCYSSPTIVGKYVYQFDDTGKMCVVKLGGKPDGKPEIIQRNSLGEGVKSCPAFQKGRMYVRGKKHLFCIETKGGGK